VAQRHVGHKHYELTDHLGNVRVVVSDMKLSSLGVNNEPYGFTGEVVSRTDYYAFGSLLPGRNYSSDSYAHGFNGMRKDDEIHGATGTSYDFGARIYDPRVGRWLSLDPLAAKYAALSPYHFAGNSPIYCLDPNGKEIVVHYQVNGENKSVSLKVPTDVELLKGVVSDNNFVGNVYESLKYLQDGGITEIDEAISLERAVNVHFEENTLEFNSRNAKNLTISYDPFSGMETVPDSEGDVMMDKRKGTGEIQSPALGLLHEIGHFLGYAKDGKKEHYKRKKPYGSDSPDRLYDNPEEKRVVDTIETPAAGKLKEPTRTNHRGKPARTKGPSSRERSGETVPVPKNTRDL